MKQDPTKIKRKKLEKLIRMVWWSAETHLWFTHNKSREGTAFHVKCVKMYIEQLKLLSELL